MKGTCNHISQPHKILPRKTESWHRGIDRLSKPPTARKVHVTAVMQRHLKTASHSPYSYRHLNITITMFCNSLICYTLVEWCHDQNFIFIPNTTILNDVKRCNVCNWHLTKNAYFTHTYLFKHIEELCIFIGFHYSFSCLYTLLYIHLHGIMTLNTKRKYNLGRNGTGYIGSRQWHLQYTGVNLVVNFALSNFSCPLLFLFSSSKGKPIIVHYTVIS